MINIVFENEHFVVCDKPGGVLSTPSRFQDEDGRMCLGTALQEKLKIQIFPVHRLDFEVSGLVMYAKNAEAHRHANAWFEKKQIQKTYRALTMRQDYSHIPDDIVNSKVKIDIEPGLHCKWESLVLRGKRRAYVSPIGKPSLTLAIYLGENKNNQLLWDLHPVTGRPHQLRFDLSRHGFPILGDKLYGSNINFSASAIALQSYEIDFKNAPGVSSLDLPEKIQISPLE